MVKVPYDKFSEVYDAIMRESFYENYTNFIVKLLKKFKFKPTLTLEVACGTGRLMNLLRKKGYAVEGLDISTGMLKVAKKKGLKVYQGDMVNFRLTKKYDLILNVFDSLNYIQKISDLRSCFKVTSKHLSKGGLFIFDMNSYYKINKIIPMSKHEYQKMGDIELFWLNSCKPNKWIIEMIMFEKEKGDKFKRYYEKHVERGYKLSEVKDALKKAGFNILAKYSDFECNKIDRRSRRWFFVAQKR